MENKPQVKSSFPFQDENYPKLPKDVLGLDLKDPLAQICIKLYANLCKDLDLGERLHRRVDWLQKKARRKPYKRKHKLFTREERMAAKEAKEGQIDFRRDIGPYVIIHKWVENQGGPKSMPLIKMKFAENHMGEYIGETRFAHNLVKKYGIMQFEIAEPGDNVCTIGYNPDTDTWYGWSHRGIQGFTGRSAKKKAIKFAESVS